MSLLSTPIQLHKTSALILPSRFVLISLGTSNFGEKNPLNCGGLGFDSTIVGAAIAPTNRFEAQEIFAEVSLSPGFWTPQRPPFAAVHNVLGFQSSPVHRTPVGNHYI